MSVEIRLGIDLGGTKCSVIAADDSYHILHKTVFPTGRDLEPEVILDKIIECCQGYVEKQGAKACRVTKIGVSCGGPLDEKTGYIYAPPNLPLWKEVPITDILSKELGAPAFLMNDANACALAEWKFGAGRNTKNMIFLTFGTGLGAGLILNGKLYRGSSGMAGEAGHIRLSDDGPYGYGKHGSFEGYCSGGGIANLANRMLNKSLSAQEVALLADQGDEKAQEVLTISAHYLGKGLAVLVDLLNPEMIVIGSIYARAREHFEAQMHQTLREEALPDNYEMCRIVPAQLGERLGDMASLIAGEG